MKTVCSVNSGVWLMDWMCMEHFFRPDVLIGIVRLNYLPIVGFIKLRF